MTSTPTADDNNQPGRVAIGVLGGVAMIPLGFVFPIMWSFAARITEVDNALVTAAGLLIPLAPLIVFIFLSTGSFAPGTSGLRWSRLMLLAGGVVEAAAIATVIVVAIESEVATWLPITMVVAGVILSGIAVFAGPRLRPPWPSVAELMLVPWASIPKRRTSVFIVVLVVLPIAAAGLVILATHPWVAEKHASGTVILLSSGTFALQAAAYAAALALAIRFWPMSSRFPTCFGRNVSFRRGIARSVYRMSELPTNATDLELARRWAAISAATFPSLVVAYGLIILGLAAGDVEQLILASRPGEASPVTLALIVTTLAALVTVFAVIAPIQLRHHAQSKQFLVTHGEPTVTELPVAQPLLAPTTEAVVQPNG